MELETHNCRKCGLTISATCSKCHRVVDVKKLDDGCIVKVTKCGDKERLEELGIKLIDKN